MSKASVNAVALVDGSPHDSQTKEMPVSREASRIPVERYTSPEWLAVERERFWPRVWQMACRLEEIPDVGDYAEYTIFDQSMLIVREASDRVRAFHNACRHRGTALGTGSGSFRAGLIVCPFHGWSWGLDGDNKGVYSASGFPPESLECDAIRLGEVRAEMHYGMAWINFDPDAPSFEESLGGMKPVLDSMGFDLMRVRWWRSLVLPANWKVAQEAFMENYHVNTTHPELAMGRGEDVSVARVHYATDPNGHSWVAEPVTDNLVDAASDPAELVAVVTNVHRVMWDGARSMMSQRLIDIQERLLADESVADAEFLPSFFREVYEDAARTGTPLPPPSPIQTGHAHVFPHITFVHELGNVLMYRSRPNGFDPNSCIFELWSLGIPAADEIVPRPTDDADIDDLWFVKQDLDNIERQGRGLRARTHEGSRLSPRYEAMIINFHEAMDRVLG